jgi:plastocyanin domain-containing protein
MQLIVLLLSLAAIGIIIWWFFGKHKGSRAEATAEGGVQKIEIVVDGGYKPEAVQLKAGVPAEITFLRKSASSCFDEVLLPDFGKQAQLPVNEPYTIQIQPDKEGVFTYSCGMHMFFGKIEVKS